LGGLVLGAWGAVQATAAGVALVLGGVLRDLMASITSSSTGYWFVYSIEWLLLVLTLWAMQPLLQTRLARATAGTSHT